MYGIWYIVIFFALIFMGVVVYAIYDKHNFLWSKKDKIACLIAIALFILIFSIVAIATPIRAEKEYYEFVEMKQIFENERSENNADTNLAILKLNEWLASARADKMARGCFSKYYYLDLEILEPISLYGADNPNQDYQPTFPSSTDSI